MKKIGFALLLAGLCAAQEAELPGFHRHDGFYLSLNAGPAFGDINLDMDNFIADKTTFSGTGFQSDIKIGGAPVENFIVSFDVITRSILGPEMVIDDITINTNNDIAAIDRTLGVGITYYIMPANVFISGTLGMGIFVLSSNGNSSSSESGFSFHAKVGKEWWAGKNWGLGLALGYGHAGADDKTDGAPPGYQGKLSTDKIAVMFNSTFN